MYHKYIFVAINPPLLILTAGKEEVRKIFRVKTRIVVNLIIFQLSTDFCQVKLQYVECRIYLCTVKVKLILDIFRTPFIYGEYL